MDNQQIFLPIKFNLTWWKDSDIRKMLIDTYFTEECIYPDDELMVKKLQNKADQLYDYYNKLHELVGLAETFDNPLYNYDKFSEGNGTTNGSGDVINAEFPMDSNQEKNVKHDKGTNDSKYQNFLHEYGNIGVQTLGDIYKSTADMYEREYTLKKQYIHEFTRLFMLSV